MLLTFLSFFCLSIHISSYQSIINTIIFQCYFLLFLNSLRKHKFWKVCNFLWWNLWKPFFHHFLKIFFFTCLFNCLPQWHIIFFLCHMCCVFKLNSSLFFYFYYLSIKLFLFLFFFVNWFWFGWNYLYSFFMITSWWPIS